MKETSLLNMNESFIFTKLPIFSKMNTSDIILRHYQDRLYQHSDSMTEYCFIQY